MGDCAGGGVGGRVGGLRWVGDGVGVGDGGGDGDGDRDDEGWCGMGWAGMGMMGHDWVFAGGFEKTCTFGCWGGGCGEVR